jgi:hypothetical protein
MVYLRRTRGLSLHKSPPRHPKMTRTCKRSGHPGPLSPADRSNRTLSLRHFSESKAPRWKAGTSRRDAWAQHEMIIRLQARKGISSVIGALHVFVTLSGIRVYLAKIARFQLSLEECFIAPPGLARLQNDALFPTPPSSLQSVEWYLLGNRILRPRPQPATGLISQPGLSVRLILLRMLVMSRGGIALDRGLGQSSLPSLTLAINQRGPRVRHADPVVVPLEPSTDLIFRSIDVGIGNATVFDIPTWTVLVITRDAGRVRTVRTRISQSLQRFGYHEPLYHFSACQTDLTHGIILPVAVPGHEDSNNSTSDHVTMRSKKRLVM